MRRLRFLAVTATTLIGLASFTPATAGTIRHDRDDQLYLDLAAEVAYEPVGMFEWTVDGSSGLASGTLISSQWVLTAAHVADAADGATLEFTVGGEVYESVNVIVNPNWTGDVSNAGDLALVQLDRAVDSVDPADLYQGTDEVGEVATIVGFGVTGTGLTGYDTRIPYGDKRAGNNLIGGLGDVIDYSSSSLMSDFDYPNSATEGKAVCLDLEYLAAPGDSGGGWFITVDDETFLVGVTSYGYATDGYVDSSYGDIMGATRVGDYMDWITEYVDFGLAGDFNGDGVVDLADYTLWRDHLGDEDESALNYQGDGGGVTLSDYEIWKANFGSSSASASSAVGSVAVPEPSSALLMLLGGSALVGLARSKQ